MSRSLRVRVGAKFSRPLLLILTLAGLILVISAASLNRLRTVSAAPPPQQQTALITPPASTATRAQEGAEKLAAESYDALPLSFEPNRGQATKKTKFLSRGAGYQLSLMSDEVVLKLRRRTQPEAGDKQTRSSAPSSAHEDDASPQKEDEDAAAARPARAARVAPAAMIELGMKLVGANPAPQIEAERELEGKSNYLVGNDPTKWQRGVPTYARARYREVYPGVDLLFYGSQRQLEYDFIVSPGARTDNIRLAFRGATKLEIDARGDLILHLPGGGAVRQPKPILYQEVAGGGRREVSGSYVRQGKNEIGFRVGAYDPKLPLVIDPVLVYSTYLDFFATSQNGGITIDSANNVYLTGADGENVYVAKLNAAGTAFVYVTLIGGGDGDSGLGIAVDTSGNAYVSGNAYSLDFPTVNAFQSVKSSEAINVSDVFVLKLDPAGANLSFSTFLGGANSDDNYGIALDPAGNAYVTGFTESPIHYVNAPPGAPFPTVNAYQGTLAGDNDAFLAKFSPVGAVVYSTYLGGTSEDLALAVAADDQGAAYVAGVTDSSNFPLQNALQTTRKGAGDLFITKFNPAGSALVYSTYLGGTSEDVALGLALDAGKNIYLTGYTYSSDFPVVNAFRGANSGSADAFVTKLNAAATALIYSTYVGGARGEQGSDIALGADGSAYVTGYTSSLNFPVVNPIQPTNAGGSDAVLFKLNAAGTGLVYSTYLGGGTGTFGGGDYGQGVALDTGGNAIMLGRTYANNFPTVNPIGSPNTYDDNAFLTKVSESGNQTIYRISGRIESNVGNPLSGITMTLSGSQTATTETDGNYYSFTGLPAGGTYTVTPARAGLTFDPPSQTFTNLSTDQTADFMQAPRAYHITGRITDAQGNGIPNLTVDISGGSYGVSQRYTDAQGNFALKYLEGGRTYTVAPRSDSYSFTPRTYTYADMRSNQTPNFTATGNTHLSVALTAPTNGATFQAPAMINVTATASSSGSPVNRVEFYANSNLIGTDTAAPYSIDWANVAGGAYTLSAVVIDNAGASKGSATSSNILVNSASGPVVTLTNPADNASLISGRYITLSANASSPNGAIAKVEFYEGTKLLGADTTGGSPYTFSYYLYAGTYELTAVATDATGAVTRSAPVHLTVRNNQPPTVTLQNPEGGPFYPSGASITINANASDPDGSIREVKFYANSTLLVTDTTAPYSVTWNNAPEGAYTLVAAATDDLGVAGYSNYLDIRVGNSAPTVALLSPGSSAQYGAPASITFQASPFDHDGAITQVEFIAGNNVIGIATTAPYIATWNNVPAGNYDVVARVTDNAGAIGYSTHVLVRVYPNLPTVRIIRPTAGAGFEGPASIVLEAEATNANSPVTSVWFYANGQNIGIVNDGGPEYGMTWTGVLAGNYTITAEAYSQNDSVGTSAPVQITVGGAGWALQEPRNEALTTASIEDVSMVSATEGWAVGQQGSIIHTTDGGLSWTKQNSGTTDPLNAVHFKDALHGWAAGNDMVYTVDGGRTWLQSNWSPDTVYGITCADLNNCFAGRGLNYLHRTTDGGRNWTVVTMPFDIGIPQFFDAQNGVASGQGGVLRTTNGGQTWTIWSRAHGGFFINFNEGWLVSGRTAEHTIDGGLTWQPQTLPADAYIYGFKFFDAQNGIGVGSQENIVRTTNGGQTWTTQRAPTFTYPLWSVSYGDATHAVAVGGGGTVLSTADGGQTWTKSERTDPPHPVNRIHANGSTHAWAANDGAQLMRTTNGGLLWSRVTLAPPTASNASDIHFAPDNLNGWASLRSTNNSNGYIYRSMDGGQTWQRNTTAPAGGPLHGIQALNAQTIVAVGATPANARVLRSTDGGATWTTPTLPANSGGLNAVHFVNAATGYAVGTNTILKTTDGGATWTRVLSLFDTLYDVSFADENNGWAIGQLQLLRTTDGGQTWTQQYGNATGNSNELLKGVYAVSPTVAWIVGNNGFVSRTTTGGQVWAFERLNSADSPFLRAVCFLDENNGWVGGNWSTGQIYRRSGGVNPNAPTVGITEPLNNSSKPAYSNLTIRAGASSPNGSIVSVDFYVNNQLLGTDTTTPYEITWHSVPPDVYLLTAIATDSAGVQSSSAPVTFTSLRPTTPTVFITNPANEATFPSNANVSIGAHASAADSSRFITRVEFYEGANLIATDTSAPYGTVWNNVTGGSYTLRAIAFDNLGSQQQSGPVNITVGGSVNQPPSVFITNPFDNSTIETSGNINLGANASDTDGTISKVDFFANRAFVGTDTSAPYGVAWSNVAEGTYTLTARATDNNLAETISAPVSIRVVASPPSPGLSIVGHVNSLTGLALSNVTITLGGATTGATITDTNGNYSFTNLTAGGSYTLTPSFDQGDYIFNPSQHNVINLQATQTRNFVGTNLNGEAGDTGALMISEFRFSGPGGALDEFVEFYNNSGRDITIQTADGSAGWALVASDGIVRFIIPVGTVIPARGHLLATNSGYSLAAYAPGDIKYTADIPDNAGIAFFKTANPSYYTSGMRFDAFGFGLVANTLYREGFNASVASEVREEELSYVRKTVNGVLQDTDENGADFELLAAGHLLGAAGPENLSSPTQRNASVKPSLVDPQSASSAPPNRVRAGTPVTNGAYGTLTVRRRFTNKTGLPVTALRFRIIDITTLGTPNTCGGCAVADLRALSSADTDVMLANKLTVTVKGTLLELAETQPGGGGVNSTLTVPLAGGALAPNASINVQFRLGVQQEGSFRFLINVEGLTGPAGVPSSNLKKEGAKETEQPRQ